MEVGPWFVQGVPILAKPAPVPGVQIVERGRKVDEEEERERKWKREGTRPALPWPHPHSKRERKICICQVFTQGIAARFDYILGQNVLKILNSPDCSLRVL